MKLILSFFLFTTLICSAQKDSVLSIEPYIIGDRVEILSTELQENRILNIYLPHGYSPDSSKTYPVIYVLDGSAHEDFLHIVGLVQFGSYSWINLVEESIVVGIENVDRKKDFTFKAKDRKLRKEVPTSGGSDAFMNFIEKEVQPYVASNYTISKARTLIGQSLGGLLASEIIIKRPNLFDKYIIVSPSIWWDNNALLDVNPEITDDLQLYIAVGDEDEEDIMKNGAINLYAKLKPFIDPEHSGFHYFEEHNHGDLLHQAVYRAFESFVKMEKK